MDWMDFLDGLGELVLFRDHRIHGQAGLELDLVQGLEVGGIGDRHEQFAATTEQRQGVVLLDELGFHFLERSLAEVHRIQVHGGYAELFGGGARDGAGIEFLVTDEVAD